MDQKGSLVDTNIKIYPSEQFISFIEKIPVSDDVPLNILRYIKVDAKVSKEEEKKKENNPQMQFTDTDIEIITRIKKAIINSTENNATNNESNEKQDSTTICDKNELTKNGNEYDNPTEEVNKSNDEQNENESDEKNYKLYLTTSDIDWVYAHINKRKNDGEENVLFLHELFQGTKIEMPQNRTIKRNPVLEARCVKLRAQQEAREYRKMTKGVDNVRMRYPEDSISYQLKQLNRQLIAIGQFILSIFAGFLFGFRGVEWMVGNLDFGVRLLLGVMCALIIALAEIYFLAKKLNEELAMTETVQIGGPPKFPDQHDYTVLNSSGTDNKEHQD